MTYKKGKMLIETRVVPNFEVVRKTLKSKTGVDPTPKEMLDHIESKRKDSQFLPITYQKIVSMALIHDAPSGTADKEARNWSVCCFTGDESTIIKNFWLHYEQTKDAAGVHPVLVTCDRKRGTLPVLVNRSFSLIRAVAIKMIDKYGMLPEEILEKGNGEENPGYRFCAPYRHIKPAMKDFLMKSDKWENNRPNYMNTYSRFTSDLSMEFSLSSVEETDILSAEKLVAEGQWDTLAKKTVESALANWKNFATGCYINNDELFLKDAVSAPYLNDPELAEYIISEPTIHPYSLVAPEIKTAAKDEQTEPVKAKILIRKPTKQKGQSTEQQLQQDIDAQFPPKQKHIEFEEGR